MNDSPLTQSAYVAMQARLVALLLRFDEDGFARAYGQREDGAPAQAAYLRPYRDLAALSLLRDELFDDLLPRIVRRLSFAAPRHLLIEEPPPCGRIAWERTLEAGWRTLPGEVPLLLHTRQRRRDFATPANLLTVAVLLEYQAALRQVLWNDQLVAQSDMLRHPLNSIVEQCERELAFPQFAGLRSQAETMLETGAIEELISQVRETALPGGNSAYADLIAWRERLLNLPLLQREPTVPTASLGADPSRDNYLYQLWIFYELAALLADQGALLQLEPRPGIMALRFRWADTTYELRHDQAVPQPPAAWQAEPAQRSAVPGVRPDFYLWRLDPPMVQLTHQGQLVWREPGLIWDAKYYREHERLTAPSSPVKRMIADLSLLGERHGTLLFAMLDANATGLDESTSRYQLRPGPRDQPLIPDLHVGIEPLCPQLDPALSRPILLKLLTAAHQQLATPRQPRCQGVFLDPLSLAEQGVLLGRDGGPLPHDDLLVCPKPHLGPWRVDLVSRSQHCCRDGHLCHIIGLPGATPPLRPPRSARELLSELERLFAPGELDQLDELLLEQTLNQIEGLTRRFAEVTGALQDLGRYEAKLGDIGLDRTLHLLGPHERESLALAIYLRDQLDEVQASDYSAAIIHVARVLERELQRRLLAIPGLSASDFPHGKPTLGSLGGVYRKNPALWALITAHLEQIWEGQLDPDDPSFVVQIEQLIPEIEILVRARNQAAHTTPIARNRFRDLLRLLCAGGPLRIGALNVLLLAWPGPDQR